MLFVEKKNNRFDEENKNVFNFNNLLFFNKAFINKIIYLILIIYFSFE